MNHTYSVLEKIWERCAIGETVDIEVEVINLLSQQGIKLRLDDGELKQINISIPITIENSFVIGLRYIKKDGSCTEDHFLCRKDHESTLERLEVEPHYKKRLEYRLPEYKGAHKEQIDFSQPFVKSGLITQVNTITYTKDSK